MSPPQSKTIYDLRCKDFFHPWSSTSRANCAPLCCSFDRELQTVSGERMWAKSHFAWRCVAQSEPPRSLLARGLPPHVCPSWAHDFVAANATSKIASLRSAQGRAYKAHEFLRPDMVSAAIRAKR